jgi:GTP diphosphokinase / guanosine-3',5'-bis(diphosphate) 3'-diphosphatase
MVVHDILRQGFRPPSAVNAGEALGTKAIATSPTKGLIMKECVTVLRAADAAARWHVHQRRKGSAEEPYINHLPEVASLVTEATDGRDPDLVVAALLHDAVEDQEVPSDLITREFGSKVAAIVAEVTDDKTVEKAERKRRQVATSSNNSDQAKMLKLADKTSNLRAIAFSPSPDWSVKHRILAIASTVIPYAVALNVTAVIRHATEDCLPQKRSSEPGEAL